jgi:16S rRNA (uracil1498-N3)-methyltransferase
MSAHRFFLTGPLVGDPSLGGSPGAEGGLTLPLSAADVHHAVDVLRIHEGEELDAVEPSGRVWRVRVTSTCVDLVHAEVLREVPGAALPQVTLVMGVAKGEKMDAVVRQATELGVDRVIPVLCERCVVKLPPSRAAEKAERWRRIALAASKQAKRASVPVVEAAAPLRDVLAELAAYDGVIVAWEESAGDHLASVTRVWAGMPTARIAVVVGPEGGLSASEVASLEAIGARVVTLGPTILRAETAALATIAVVMSVLLEPGTPDD